MTRALPLLLAALACCAEDDVVPINGPPICPQAITYSGDCAPVPPDIVVRLTAPDAGAPEAAGPDADEETDGSGP